MDISTGQLYETRQSALSAGVLPENLVFIEGAPEAVERVSTVMTEAARQRRKARNKAAKMSRRANRKA